MTFKIIAIHDFKRSLKSLARRHRSLKEDFATFAENLAIDPFQGDELSPGIRKIRMAITSKGRGKSGGARIITYTVVVDETRGEIYLIDIYDKADFSTVDINRIKSIIADLGL